MLYFFENDGLPPLKTFLSHQFSTSDGPTEVIAGNLIQWITCDSWRAKVKSTPVQLIFHFGMSETGAKNQFAT